MNLSKERNNHPLIEFLICGILVFCQFCACQSENLTSTPGCGVEPNSELNLFKEEVIYRLLYAQNVLIYGTNPEFHSYDPSRIGEKINDLLSDPALVDKNWWEVMKIRFEEFWLSLPDSQGELDELEWLHQNLDLMCTAYAFEILHFEVRNRLYPLIADLVERKEELREFWKEQRTLLPNKLEYPRISQMKSLLPQPESDWKTKLQDRRPLIIAHRGGFSPFPENSLDSIRSAYLSGYDGIECDLRLTADGEVVVLHDEDLAGLTHQDVQTSNLSLDALMRLRLRDPFRLHDLSSLPPLTLKTLFDQFGGKFLLWLELKPIGGSELPNKVSEMIREYQLEDSIIVASLSMEMVAPLRDEFENLRIAFEYNRISDRQARIIKKLSVADDANRIIISCEEFQNGQLPILNWLQDNSILTSTFTPNRFDALSHSIKAGIDLIQTDRPDRARLLLSELH